MTTSSAKPTRWIMVPADARFDICPCGKRQYWVHTRTGKPMPVDCDVEGGKRPLIVRDISYFGQGVSHFATCPRAKDFRRPR